MRKITPEELALVLSLHAEWLCDSVFGSRADLSRTDFTGADFVGVDLTDVSLAGADLTGARLACADLTEADLTDADLTDADLTGARLVGARLARADLTGACLTGTVCDPSAAVPVIADTDIAAASLTLDGPYIVGYRTATSQHCCEQYYEPGKCYTAPYFSVDTATPCHPGIYLAGKDWLAARYPSARTVQCRALRTEMVHAGDKWRAKRIWIANDDGTWPGRGEEK